MRLTLVVVGNDLRRRLRDRTFYIQGILAPLVMATIVGLAFGGGFSFEATIGVADADGSSMSRGLVDGLLSANDKGSPVTFERVDADDVDDRVDSGDVDAVIVLPSGFGESVTGTSPEPITVVVDAGKRITADVTTSVADRMASRLDGVRLAVNAAVRTGPQPPDAERIQQVVAEAQAVEQSIGVTHDSIGGAYSPIAYFAPSMGMLFLFFTIGAGARSLLTERQQGTLSRLRSAPVSDAQILLGKTGGVLVLGLASFVVLWAVTSSVFHAAWGDPLAVLLVIVGVVFATAGISIFVTAIARTDAQAEGLTSMVAFVLALLGGNFMSPGSSPPLLEKLSMFTPNGWALRALTDLGAGGAGVIDVLGSVAVMIGIGLVAGVIGIRMLARRVLR
ncbi:MAG: ABC transporter permease [Microthrixaceae bacterium]